MSSIVNDDIVTFIDLGIVNNTEKHVSDMHMGRGHWINRGSMLLRSEEKLDALPGYTKDGSQVLLEQLCISNTTFQW